MTQLALFDKCRDGPAHGLLFLFGRPLCRSTAVRPLRAAATRLEQLGPIAGVELANAALENLPTTFTATPRGVQQQSRKQQQESPSPNAIPLAHVGRSRCRVSLGD